MKRALAVVLIAIMAGCAESPTEYVAEEFTPSQIARQPGFAWFSQEKAAYAPDPARIDQIRAKAGSIVRCYLFVNPSCGCNGTQRHFPHFVRCMEEAGIPDSLMTVVSMRTTSTRHNHMHRFHVQHLPTFFISWGDGSDIRIEPPDDPNVRIEDLIVQTLP